MKTGATFPPIKVALIDKKYYLVDGKHRLEAHVINNVLHIQAIVDKNIKTKEELYVESIKSNRDHGRPLSYHDKQAITKKLERMDFGKEEISRILLIPEDKLELSIPSELTPAIGNKKNKSEKTPPPIPQQLYKEAEREFENQKINVYVIRPKYKNPNVQNTTFIRCYDDIKKLKRFIIPDYEIGVVATDLEK